MSSLRAVLSAQSISWVIIEGQSYQSYSNLSVFCVFKGLTMRFNMPAGTNMIPTNFNSQTPYIPFNLGALSAMSNQQLEVSHSAAGVTCLRCCKHACILLSQIMLNGILKYLDIYVIISYFKYLCV